MIRDCCILQRKRIMTLVYSSVKNLKYRNSYWFCRYITHIRLHVALQLAVALWESVICARVWFVSWREAKCYEGWWNHVCSVLPRPGTLGYLCVSDGKYRLCSMMSSNRSNENNPSTIMNTKEKEKYIEEFDFPYCDEATKYEKVAKIGQGTFG